MIDVLCIGHAAWDLNFQLARYPVEDTKGSAEALAQSGGGPAANAAYLLASWGVRCGFAGVVGDDEYGRWSLDELRDAGVDVSWSEVRSEHQTPLSVVLVNGAIGSRTILTHKAVTGPLALDPRPGHEPRVLLFDGHEIDASLRAIRAYPDAVTIFDAGSLRDGSRELARQTDYLVCSEHFAVQLIGRPLLPGDAGAEAVSTLRGLTRGYEPVVITCGDRGLICGMPDGVVERQPAFPIRAVDTTAAGDIFHGAFAYGVLTGRAWPDVLRLAAAAAAISATKPGGRTSIPSLAEVEALM